MTQLRHFLAIALCLAWPVTGLALDVENEYGTWMSFARQGAFGDTEDQGRWRWMWNGQLRSFSTLEGVQQAVFRTGAGYRAADNVTLWGGYAYYHTNFSKAGSRNEHRAWQQLNWTVGRWDWGSLKSRTRLEQRWVDGRDDNGMWIRQQFRTDIPIKRRKNLALILGIESFFHLRDTDWTERGFIQNRAFVGLGTKPAPRLKVEIGYMNQIVQVRSLPELMNHLLIVNFRPN